MDLRTIDKIVLRGFEYPLPTKIEIDLDVLNEMSKFLNSSELTLYLLFKALNKHKAEDKNE